MARVPYANLATASDEVRAEARVLPDWNIFRMMAHANAGFLAYSNMGRTILTGLDLSPTLRELAIIRVGVVLDAPYEVAAHLELGRRIGLSREKIGAARQRDPTYSNPALSALERAVIRFVDETLASTRPSDSTFDFLLEKLGVVQLQQLTLTVGYYAMTSMFLNTYDVDSEESVSLGLEAIGRSKSWGS